MTNTKELDDFLAHYGVMGMKWGVRNDETLGRGQVSAEKQAKRDAKAQKYVNRASRTQTAINQLQAKKPRGYFDRKRIRSDLEELVKQRDQALNDAERKRQGKLSSGQKKAIIGGSIVAGLIAAKVIHDTAQSGDLNRISERVKALARGEKFSYKIDNNLRDILDPNEVFEKVVKEVNPDFGDIGTKMNCRRATFAYEMRRRGYDVQATRTG